RPLQLLVRRLGETCHGFPSHLTPPSRKRWPPFAFEKASDGPLELPRGFGRHAPCFPGAIQPPRDQVRSPGADASDSPSGTAGRLPSTNQGGHSRKLGARAHMRYRQTEENQPGGAQLVGGYPEHPTRYPSSSDTTRASDRCTNTASLSR